MSNRFLAVVQTLSPAIAIAALAASCAGSDDDRHPNLVDAYHLGCTQPDATHSVSCPCATTDDLRNIGDAVFLERMSIAPVGSIDFKPLGRLTHLHALIISVEGQVDLRSLEGLDRIRELAVATTDVDWKPISKMTHLDKLVLVDSAYGQREKTFDLSFVGDLTNLEVLDISQVLVNDLSWLSRLDNLKRLKLRCASCDTPEGVAAYRAANPALSSRESHGTTADYARSGPTGAICEIDPKACPKSDECDARTVHSAHH